MFFGEIYKQLLKFEQYSESSNSFFTLSLFAVDSRKKGHKSLSYFRLSCRKQRHTRFRSYRSFPSSFLIALRASALLFGD